MQIKIPFSEEMQGRIWQDMKFCTSRNKKYGEPGDWFSLLLAKSDKGVWISTIYTHHVLVAVEQLELEEVANHLYWAEGFHSPKDFIRTWNMLHPRKKYGPKQKVWVHWFREATMDEDDAIEEELEEEE